MLSQDEFVIAALLEEGVVDRASLDAAIADAAERSITTCDAIIAQGKLSSRQMTLVRAETSEYPYADLAAYDINIRNSAVLTRSTAETLLAFPLFVIDDVATVAMANPLDLKAVDQLRAVLKLDVDPVVCEPAALRDLIERAYALGSTHEDGDTPAATAPTGTSGVISLKLGKEPIVQAVNQIIVQGVDLNASDIHIGPDEDELHLRYRIDGTLRAFQGPGISQHPGIVQRLKVMANIDLTQSRRPQDGKFRIVHQGRNVDIRLSIIPTVCGENAVLRLLASGTSIKDFHSLGFRPQDSARFEQALESPYGIILVTGPTGSGKTTTLYTALKRLNTPDVNIMTIEDPVEIRLARVRQIQVNPEVGMTFAGALRSVLRQDPDIVFVGEIRDEETARISVQAALTGHMVLSSLHTNDAAGAIPRLRDLGCPSFAINAALLSVLAQRLVRRVCADCARDDQPHAALFAKFCVQPGESRFMRGVGCARCSKTGYRGRIGIYEILTLNAAIRKAIDSTASTESLREIAEQNGMSPMWRDGLEKAKLGLTTLDEVGRTVAIQSTGSEQLAPSPAPTVDLAPARMSA